jgi:glyoxalase family protein
MDGKAIHHSTLISGDARRTVDFYPRILAARLVKQPVIFDVRIASPVV